MNFEMLGKISLSKETDKFKPYSEHTYDSGWVRKRLMFNAVCGDNRHMLTVDAGAFADGHGDIYSFTKGGIDANGNRIKGESIKIPFKDRLTSPKIAEIAEFKKFIVDLEKPNRRYKLQNAAEKIKEGTSLTDEELTDLGIESESEVKAELEKSNKKRHEFISEWDFVSFVKKIIDSGKYTNAKFLIRGNGNYQYSDNNQRVYESYIPNRIYLADENAEEYSTATFNLIYGADGLDEMCVEEKGKYYVNGYVMEYDNNRRCNIPVPTTITFDAAKPDATDKEKKLVEAIKRKFVVEDESYKELGVVVDMLNGAQRTKIKLEDLDEDVQLDIELGITTLEDVARDLGGSVYGERVREYKFTKLARGFSRGRNDTVYTSDDMVIKPIEDATTDLFDEETADDDEL